MDDGVIVPVAFLLSVVAIVKIIADSRMRSKLIEKGVSADEARALLSSSGRSTRDASLKWGLVTGSIGAALIVVHLAGVSGNEPIAAGLVLLFAGLGLLSHYALTNQRLERLMRLAERHTSSSGTA